VIEPFTKLGLIPLSVQTRLYQESEELAVDIQIAGLSDEQCRRIASQIETMPFSIRVVTCRKHFV
jgi:predicted component of type VI protein secretion system